MKKKYLAIVFVVLPVTFFGLSHNHVESGTARPHLTQDTYSAFYSVRRDLRRCAWPMCSGYWIKNINQRMTKCANDTLKDECYVVDVDTTAAGAGADKQDKTTSIFRGSVQKETDPKARGLGVFKVSELWIASSSHLATGKFYRLKDNGVRCITQPCFNLDAAELNSEVIERVSEIELNETGASADWQQAARRAISGNSLLAAGVIQLIPRAGPAGDGKQFVASQFYLKFVPRQQVEEKGNCFPGSCPTGMECKYCRDGLKCVPKGVICD